MQKLRQILLPILILGLVSCGVTKPIMPDASSSPTPFTQISSTPTIETPTAFPSATATETASPSPTPSLGILNNDDLKSKIDRLVTSFFEQTQTPGLGIAVVIRNPQTGRLEAMLLNYGTTAKDGSESMTSDTVYEIGSITKVFTGILLAEAVNAGKVKFDDPIQKYLPAGIQAPTYNDTPITLVNLATHHAALPRDLESDNISDMYAWLNTFHLTQAPGTKYNYSNLGYSLLGDILARLSGNDFGALEYQAVSKPLGLLDTSETLSSDQENRLAQGYTGDGALATYFPDSGAMSSAGYLHSTLNDMTQFLVENMQPDTTSLASSIRLAQMNITDGQEPGSGTGLGWEIERPNTPTERIYKGGGTPGFTTYISFANNGSSGFVLLTNGQYVNYLVPTMLHLLGEDGN